jgi:hypothetical protein
MSKNLTLVINQQKFAAGIVKVDRDKLYGHVEEVVHDKDGNLCIQGNLLDDGQTIILSGSSALKTVNDKLEEVDKQTLMTVYQNGQDAVLIPSSFDGEIELQPSSLEDLFNLEVTSVYQLTWEDESSKSEILKKLDGGFIFHFIFNYRADYEGADALVISSQKEVFILTGRILSFEYLENKTATPIMDEVAEENEEELDFGML